MKIKPIPLLVVALTCSLSAWAEDSKADNTGNNTRDQSGETMTPTDQSNDPADIQMTAEIRKAIVADESLSVLAKNVKVITVAEVVTLRGPVENAGEKAAIANYAEQAKAKKVINEIEVK